MDGQILFGTNGTAFINWFTNNVNDSAEGLWANGNLNGVASINDGLTAHETFGGVKSDGTHVVATQMLGNFEN